MLTNPILLQCSNGFTHNVSSAGVTTTSQLTSPSVLLPLACSAHHCLTAHLVKMLLLQISCSSSPRGWHIMPKICSLIFKVLHHFAPQSHLLSLFPNRNPLIQSGRYLSPLYHCPLGSLSLKWDSPLHWSISYQSFQISSNLTLPPQNFLDHWVL